MHNLHFKAYFKAGNGISRVFILSNIFYMLKIDILIIYYINII